MNLSMKQKQTHRHREQTCGCQGGRDGLGVWDEQMQTNIYRMDKQQGPTVYHRELCSVSCDKPQRRRIRRRMYIGVWLSHFAVQQKLTQHCKSTILQLNKF